VDDRELDELRQRRLREIEQQAHAQAQEQARREEAALQRQAVLRAALTPEARERLSRLKMARPEVAENLEAQLAQLAVQGRIREPLTDEQLKQILAQTTKGKRDIKIERR
jgi:programmed cell death protein 5